MSTTSIVILCILDAVIFYILGHCIAKQKNKKDRKNFNSQIERLIKTYNTDTARLQDDNTKLRDRNLSLSEKIRNIETDLLSYKTKYKSVKTDLDRFMNAKKPCDHKCERHCLKEQPTPKKRGRKPKIK